jgi:hypothetical protein
MPDYNYTRSLIDGFWNVDVKLLALEVSAMFTTKLFRLRASELDVVFDFQDELTVPEQALLDEAVGDHKLAQPARNLETCKQMKCSSIGIRTAELEAQGFEYNSLFFGMDADCRVNVAQLNAERDDPIMPWNQGGEMLYGALHDSGCLHITSAAVIHDFYLAGINAYITSQAGGNLLKEQVRALTTIAEVQAFVDPR